jgi:hypothetical protein
MLIMPDSFVLTMAILKLLINIRNPKILYFGENTLLQIR